MSMLTYVMVMIFFILDYPNLITIEFLYHNLDLYHNYDLVNLPLIYT